MITLRAKYLRWSLVSSLRNVYGSTFEIGAELLSPIDPNQLI